MDLGDALDDAGEAFCGIAGEAAAEALRFFRESASAFCSTFKSSTSTAEKSRPSREADGPSPAAVPGRDTASTDSACEATEDHSPVRQHSWICFSASSSSSRSSNKIVILIAVIVKIDNNSIHSNSNIHEVDVMIACMRVQVTCSGKDDDNTSCANVTTVLLMVVLLARHAHHHDGMTSTSCPENTMLCHQNRRENDDDGHHLNF